MDNLTTYPGEENEGASWGGGTGALRKLGPMMRKEKDLRRLYNFSLSPKNSVLFPQALVYIR